MQHRMTEKYISRPARWLLQNNVSYWHQGLQQFRYSNGDYQLTATDSAKPGRIIIISRLHYQEFLQYYPVTRLHELKQVLQTEFEHKDNVIHFIGPVEEQRRAVSSIVLADETASHFSHNCILIPETLLLWRGIKADKAVAQPAVYQITAFTGFFLYCGDVIPVSQRINSFCPDYASFMLNNGVSDLARLQQITDKQYANQLVKALGKALPGIARLALFRRPSFNSSRLPLKAIALTATAVAMAYMLLVAGYYHIAIDKRQTAIATLGSDVNQLLELQQQVQATSADAAKLVQLRADKKHSAHLWLVLIPLLQQDASLALQNLSTENDRIIIRGQANQATAVLTGLQASALVTDARFDASVRRQNNKDNFVISLLLAQQALAGTDSSVKPSSQPEAANAAQ